MEEVAMLSMLICHLCHTEIVLPANNVRFREPGKTGYVYFHDSDKRHCWGNWMVRRIEEAKKTAPKESAKIYIMPPINPIEAT
jgi:hypothetical protein